MKETVLIVLYKDGTLGVFAHPRKMKSDDFEYGARFFEASDMLPIIELCEWQSKGFKHHSIEEIELR